jgi:hypothetical protein
VSPLISRKKSTSTVSSSPLANVRVPLSNRSESPAPCTVTGTALGSPPSAMPWACSANFWKAAIGRLKKLRRSSNSGIPVGNFCAQLAAGPDSAVPNPASVPKSKKDEENGGDPARRVDPLEYPHRWSQH